jgi:hypothetical protein
VVPWAHRRVQPRRLLIEEAEAVIIRRIFTDSASKATIRIAAELNAEGVKRRVDRPWTKDAIKDIQRRGRVYLGFAVKDRGVDEVKGTHEPIIDEPIYRAAMAGTAGRFRDGVRTARHRVYALRGLLTCGNCGANMRGEARSARGKEWRYYLCRSCDAPSVPADAIEAEVYDHIRTLTLPAEAIERARHLLLERLQVPETGTVDAQRKRLNNRLSRLKELYGWEDLTEAEYRAKVLETRTLLSGLPTEDKVILFDRHRHIVETMAANLDKATEQQKADLVRLLVERAYAKDRSLAGIDWTPPVRPFFDVSERPRTDSNRRRRP